MIKIVKYSDPESTKFIQDIVSRGGINFERYFESVSEIIKNIKTHRDTALVNYSRQFDNFDLNSKNYFFTPEDFKEAYNSLSPHIRSILDNAARRIENFHSNQKERSWFTYEENGSILGQKFTPLESVALYVPGGKALYPSTVLMTGIPAKIAGVENIFITSPIFDFEKGKAVLAAAHIVGAKKLYKIGGAQAVAAVTFGTDWIKKVDKIVGPGNIYVTVAKKLLFGNIDIDMIAGPSEILIIADNTANAEHIVFDMFSQAEHDELASSILITTSEKLAFDVSKKIEEYSLSAQRREILQKSLSNNGLILIVDTLENAVNISNMIAPEHLEVITEAPFNILPQIKNAGAIFLGPHSPEPIGDYMAGPNHVLPTSGTARFFSPLGVYDFCKRSSVIAFSKRGFDILKESVSDFAILEGLQAHSDSIKIRKDEV